MRRVLSLLLTLLLLFGCTDGNVQTPEDTSEPAIETPGETMAGLAAAILDSQSDREAYSLLSAEDIEFYLTALYGVPGDTMGLVYTVGDVDAREIAVLYTSGDENAAGALEAYRGERYGDFFGYVPDQAQLIQEGVVLENGGWAVLLLCTDPDAAREAIDKTYSELALHPYDPGEEVYDWTKYYDERGWRICTPPNEFDMTIYDTAAIREAWASGDERALTQRETAILAKSREVLAACVTADMTPVEKELALHDWVIDHMAYDWSLHEKGALEGKPADELLYRAMTESKGICLSYASAFQLLMDLAGVECLTVVGAASDSSQDHAWNMVKLDGEWYCVDVTWDDTSKPVANQRERNHLYFNVTSDEMRRTNHQWDYDNIPEATATAYSWDNLSGQ